MEIIESKYKHLLEQYRRNDKLASDICNTHIYACVLNIIQNRNIENVLVSLSGGVDSMVLLELLIHIPKINVYCCHLNYNNRSESKEEMEFLIEYCKHKNVILEYIEFDFVRSETKRDMYEKETRKMRYEYYSKLVEKYDCECVMLAHHQDDIVENIYNNVMRGCRDPHDLIVLRELNTILGVNVCRPLLSVYKDCVYDCAFTYNIPYFLDTTPDWSCRGKMRRKIFPSCEDCYGSQYKQNIIQIGNDCEAMGNIIQTYIIDNILENDVKIDGENFTITLKDVLTEKMIIKSVLKKILHKLGLNMIKMKSIDQLLTVVRSKKQQKITLLKNYNTMVNENSIVFTKIA